MLTRKSKKTNKEWLKINAHLFPEAISLSLEDYDHLFAYKRQVCKKLEWVELDHSKLRKLIVPIMQDGNIGNQQDMEKLKMAIRSYYIVRSQKDWHFSDDYLCLIVKKALQNSYEESTSIIEEMMRLLKQEDINE